MLNPFMFFNPSSKTISDISNKVLLIKCNFIYPFGKKKNEHDLSLLINRL
jgi:hypothetical protein